MTAIFVNTGLDSPLEILYNANTHVLRNRANEACHIPLQLINCSWLIKVHIIFTITPQKEVQRVQVRGVRGPRLSVPTGLRRMGRPSLSIQFATKIKLFNHSGMLWEGVEELTDLYSGFNKMGHPPTLL